MVSKTINITKKTVKTVKTNVITVKNADGDPDTTATIVIQNKIKHAPKVSVIIPVYNVEKYLRESLDSVINQTLKEIEIICVDDGSTDSSLDILKEYAKKDNRITVITQENHGAGISRNCGIGVAKGEFIAFMDPDDYYPANETLEHLYIAAIKNKVDICGGKAELLKNGQIEISQEYVFKKYGLLKYSDYQYDYGYWRFIFNRKMLIDNKIYFPDYLRGQDPVFFVLAMVAAEQFYAIDEVTYIYRIKGFLNVNWTQRKLEDIIKSWIDILNISKKHKFYELHTKVLKRIDSDYFVKNFFNRLYSMNNNTELFKKLYDAIDFKKLDKKTLPVKLCVWLSAVIPEHDTYKILKRYKIKPENKVMHFIRHLGRLFGSKIKRAREYPIRTHEKYHHLKDKIRKIKNSK